MNSLIIFALGLLLSSAFGSPPSTCPAQELVVDVAFAIPCLQSQSGMPQSDFVTSDWFFSLQYKTKQSILNDDVQCPASVPSCSISPSNGTCYRGVDVPFSTEPPYLVPCGCCQREYASFPPLNSEWTTTTATSTLTVDAGYGQTLEHPSCPEPINRTCASEAKVPVCTQCGNARASFAYPPLPFVHTHVALARRSITHTPRRSQRTSTKASSPSSRTPMIPVKS